MVSNRISFGWNSNYSTYQNMKIQRARIATYASNTQSMGTAVSNALATAQTNQMTGMNTIAGQRGAARVQTELKVALTKAGS